ncbi:MAG: four helix bundle protein [Flavobacteriaceae bacterium]|nr:MAG: four helix bundle protein [Flavobacteriaceae bacterium]
MDVYQLVYEITQEFPKNERYGLTSQFTRAAVSISLNIAEGAGDTDAQFNRFLKIALGSVKECVVCSTIASRQQFIDQNSNNINREKLEELSKMIIGLQKYLNSKNTSKD